MGQDCSDSQSLTRLPIHRDNHPLTHSSFFDSYDVADESRREHILHPDKRRHSCVKVASSCSNVSVDNLTIFNDDINYEMFDHHHFDD